MRAILILSLVSFLVVPSFANEAERLSNDYNQVFADFLRKDIVKIPVNSYVMILLKDGSKVVGRFLGYNEKEDDAVWIMPLGKRYIFDKDAYDVRQIQNVRILKGQL